MTLYLLYVSLWLVQNICVALSIKQSDSKLKTNQQMINTTAYTLELWKHVVGRWKKKEAQGSREAIAESDSNFLSVHHLPIVVRCLREQMQELVSARFFFIWSRKISELIKRESFCYHVSLLCYKTNSKTPQCTLLSYGYTWEVC